MEGCGIWDLAPRRQASKTGGAFLLFFNPVARILEVFGEVADGEVFDGSTLEIRLAASRIWGNLEVLRFLVGLNLGNLAKVCKTIDVLPRNTKWTNLKDILPTSNL